VIANFRLIILFSLLQIAALRVIAQPVANFAVSASSGCSPLSETFTNITTGGTLPYSYLWKLGNSNISTLQNASAIYYIPGTYNITLIVTDAKGKTDSVTKSITVFKPPTAKFSTAVQKGCSPLKVSFTDLSSAGSGNIASWLWDFGDGNTSTSQNPGYHIYSSPGTYNVSLDVTDANGCTSSVILSAYIYVDQPPAVSFSAPSTFGCSPPFTVNFSSSVSPSSPYDTYFWEFGDGTTGTGQDPTKTYSSTGSYTVTLTVTDSFGCTTTKTMYEFIYVGKPVASFGLSPSEGCAPLSVSFTNTTTGAPPGSKFIWDFGDGSGSASADPSHTYQAGSYTVKLIVTAPGGCSDTVVVKDAVKASKPFVPRFSADSILCQEPFIGSFTNESGPGTKVVSWNFGDGTPSVGGNSVNHIFPLSGGTFSVTLTVEDTDGCVETKTESNFIKASPVVALFSPKSVKGCVPVTVTFSNLSTSIDIITTSLWNFGDGTTSNAFNPPAHTYTNPGIYTVSLKVTTKQGCTATFNGTVSVGEKPKANFISYPDSGCLNKLRHVHFINLTNVNASVKADSFWWDFGVGTTSDSELTVSFNDTPGVYEVTLVAYNNETCPDTLKKEHLIIIDSPWAYYNVIRDTCALQNKVTFIDKSIGATHVEYYFGDGDSSDERNPTHIYTKPGLYFPIQIAYDSSDHCSDTFSFYARPPLLNGLYIKPTWKDSIWPLSDTVGCSPLTVFFKLYDNDTATNLVVFGDADTLTEQTPVDTIIISHTYETPGIYEVIMPATNDQGCKKQDTMKRRITVLGLRTAFSVSPLIGCVPLTVTLTDSFPNEPGVINSYYDMGNGDHVTATSQTTTYTYTKPPANQTTGFKIKLVKSNISCSDTAVKTVYPIQPSTRIFQFNLSTCDSIAYVFSPQTTGFKPFRYLWHFDNMDSSTSNQPSFTFKVGSYDVRLKVTDSVGCVDTLSFPIDVQSTKDTADFVVKLSKGNCPPITASFIDESKFAVPGPHTWLWDFGDGEYSTLENPSKVYYTAGTFTVTLKISDILGCTSTDIKPNVITIKGPTGEYSFDPKIGCNPVTVHFNAVSSNATKFEWDFGDGSPFGHFDTATHVYKVPGSYIPSLVLSDTSCSYGLPPTDTIVVSPTPIADFGYDSTCSGQPITLKDMSASKAKIVHWVWNFGDGSSPDNRQDPTHIYKKNGFYQVTLSVTNNAGCTGSITKSVKYGDIIAQFKAPGPGCVGSQVQFKDLTLSDSAIKSWYWLFGDGTSSSLQNPTHTYLKPGIFPVSLYVENYKGCYDSLKDGANIIIGDTISPKPPFIYRVTVADDNTIELDFGKDSDYDFEKYLIYVRDESGKVRLLDSVFNVLDTIYMEQGLNNLHHSYCFLVQSVNVCGYSSDTSSSLYHCTINLDASPGINQSLLNWTPYIGWAVGQYKIYRQGAETPPQFDILDSVPGSQLKYIDTSVICYRKMVYRVEGIENGGKRQVSWSDTAATIPIHIPNVPPANMVLATVENNKNTRVEWQTVPNGHVKNWMLEKSVDGVNFKAIDTPIVCNVLTEADQQVDVQKISYTYRLRILDSCGDLGPYSNIGKTILLNIDTNADVKPYLVWTAYKNWPEGVQYYDIDIENADNGYDWLARTASGQDTEFTDNITDLNSLPFYTYHVVAHRNGTLSDPNKNLSIMSMSNDATLRPHSRLYIPNAFTPNGDGINDSFFVEGLYINEFHIKIFDRWGTKVFESGSMKDKWSGSYKNGPPIMDAYKYLIYYRGVDNLDKYVVGWVTLLE